MKLRHLTQKALRKTASSLLNLEANLEPTPAESMVKVIRSGDIPDEILIEALDLIADRLETYAAEVSHA